MRTANGKGRQLVSLPGQARPGQFLMKVNLMHLEDSAWRKNALESEEW